RCESFDLRLDPLCHVERRATWDVTVCPSGLTAGRHPRRIEQAGLRKENKWPRRVATAADLSLGSGDLIERASQMNGPRAQASSRRPRNRTVERPVELEAAHAIAITAQPAHVAGRQLMAGQPYNLSRGEVQEDRTRLRKLVNRIDPPGC